MSRRLSSLAPLDDDDLLREILLRLPPQPSSLPRASLVCTRWRGVLSDAHFLGRFRERHGKPPLLGFFTGGAGARHVFSPFMGSPDRIPADRFPVPRSRKAYDRWDLRGCRHGLAVLVNDRGREAVVWDPLTGHHRRLRVPFRRGRLPHWHAVVMRAEAGEDGHAHGGCFSIPFKLVLMCQGETRAFACLYSSASGAWGNVVSTATTTDSVLSRSSGVLVGNAVHCLFLGGGVLVFDIETQILWCRPRVLSALTDRRLFSSRDSFHRECIVASVWRWWWGMMRTLSTIVLATDIGVFMLQIESMQLTTICNTSYTWDSKFFYPYRNFYTAGREVQWKWVNPEL